MPILRQSSNLCSSWILLLSSSSLTSLNMLWVASAVSSDITEPLINVSIGGFRIGGSQRCGVEFLKYIPFSKFDHFNQVILCKTSRIKHSIELYAKYSCAPSAQFASYCSLLLKCFHSSMNNPFKGPKRQYAKLESTWLYVQPSRVRKVCFNINAFF